jgi:AraC-like DNA-binding protein
LMVGCVSLSDTIEKLSRYVRVLADVGVSVELERHGARLRVPRSDVQDAFGAEILFTRLVSSTRQQGLRWVPASVRFVGPRPMYAEELEHILGTRCTYGCWINELVVGERALGRRLPARDPAVVAQLQRYADEILGTLPGGDPFIQRVRAAIGERMREAPPTLPDIARRLHIPPRSLQRRLTERGTSFKRLGDEIRRELVTAALECSRSSITGTALSLGFADVAGLYRALKRWTGLSPSAFRTLHRSKR